MTKLNIESKRLLIRSLKDTDLDDFYFYRSNPEVTKYQGFDVYTREQAREFIASQQNKQFGRLGLWTQHAIVQVSSGQLIGDCAIKFDQYDARIAEIGITISHTEQKKGFAKEAMLAILTYLFGRDDFHRVSEIVDVENVASIRLLESIGFKREGHFIENIFFNGKWGSEYQYAMLRKEWEELKR